MNKASKLIATYLDTLTNAMKERESGNQLVRQVTAITGFRGDDAQELIALLLVWHFVSQDKEIQHKLSHYGVRVTLNG